MPIAADRDRDPKPRKVGKASRPDEAPRVDVAPASRGRERYPTDVVGERVLKLAMTSARPQKMQDTIASAVSSWRTELWAATHILRERVEILSDNLAAGYDAAAEAVEEMDRSDDGHVKVAEANLASLGYARDAAMREYSKLVEPPVVRAASALTPVHFTQTAPMPPEGVSSARPVSEAQQLMLDMA